MIRQSGEGTVEPGTNEIFWAGLRIGTIVMAGTDGRGSEGKG